MKSIKCLTIILVSMSLVSAQIMWQPGDWAFGCDFTNNDFTNKITAGDKCGPTCVSTPGCTHFTWNPKINGGTCWMKTGAVGKSNAFAISDRTVVCGVVQKTPCTSCKCMTFQACQGCNACLNSGSSQCHTTCCC